MTEQGGYCQLSAARTDASYESCAKCRQAADPLIPISTACPTNERRHFRALPRRSKRRVDDRYTLNRGHAFMSGVHALVRLPMLQQVRDAQAGHNTAGFICGYRGSPLGHLRPGAMGGARAPQGARTSCSSPASTRSWRRRRCGARSNWSSTPRTRSSTAYSGSGTARARVWTAAAMCSSTPTSPAPHRLGGVIAVAGDDHVSKSSTLAHQSDHTFMACGLPIFAPANVQEILDLGLHAFG